MSYFNADQRDYMDGLAAMPADAKCWCGWFALGECHSCPPDVTAADKLRARCPGCGNDPGPHFARLIVHRIGCERDRDARAITFGLVDLGGEA